MSVSTAKNNPAIAEGSGFIDGRTLVGNLLKIWAGYTAAFFLILIIYASTAGLSVASIFSMDVLRGAFSVMAFAIASAVWAQMFLGICLLGALYFSFINIFKRVRDIRGIENHEFEWRAAIILICITPTANLLLLSFLFIKEGRLSAPSTAVSLDELFRAR